MAERLVLKEDEKGVLLALGRHYSLGQSELLKETGLRRARLVEVLKKLRKGGLASSHSLRWQITVKGEWALNGVLEDLKNNGKGKG